MTARVASILHAQEQSQIAAVAAFEARTTAKIMSNLVQQRFEALKARRESNLNLRRQRLAEKLDAEERALREELLNSKQTPEQRRAELAGRARALAAKREADRQALAQSLYERAFQENCDVLREANSKRILYRTLDERDAQVSLHASAWPPASSMRGTRLARCSVRRRCGRACRAQLTTQAACMGAHVAPPARTPTSLVADACRARRAVSAAAQIEQRMATRIMESEEKAMWHELNVAEADRAEQR